MKSATLSQYLAIVKALGNTGPLTSDELFSLGLIDAAILDRTLAFLVKQDLIKEMKKSGGVSPGYVVTARGFKILGFFGFLYNR